MPNQPIQPEREQPFVAAQLANPYPTRGAAPNWWARAPILRRLPASPLEQELEVVLNRDRSSERLRRNLICIKDTIFVFVQTSGMAVIVTVQRLSDMILFNVSR